MRSAQIYRALNLIPNRFTLCQTISKSAQRIHVSGSPFEDTVTVILKGMEDGLFRGQVETRLRREDNELPDVLNPEFW